MSKICEYSDNVSEAVDYSGQWVLAGVSRETKDLFEYNMKESPTADYFPNLTEDGVTSFTYNWPEYKIEGQLQTIKPGQFHHQMLDDVHGVQDNIASLREIEEAFNNDDPLIQNYCVIQKDDKLSFVTDRTLRYAWVSYNALISQDEIEAAIAQAYEIAKERGIELVLFDNFVPTDPSNAPSDSEPVEVEPTAAEDVGEVEKQKGEPMVEEETVEAVEEVEEPMVEEKVSGEEETVEAEESKVEEIVRVTEPTEEKTVKEEVPEDEDSDDEDSDDEDSGDEDSGNEDKELDQYKRLLLFTMRNNLRGRGL